MASSTVISKKKRGPVPTGKGTPVLVRLLPAPLDALDAWIAARPEPRPTRPEAIRRILAEALAKPADAGSIAPEDLNASNDE